MSKETMLAPDFSKQATRGFDTTYQKTSCGASCNICGSSRRKSVYSKRKDQDSEHSKTYTITKDITSQPYEIVECLECGLIYTLSQDSRASLLEEYSSMEDGLYLKEANGRRKAAKRVLDEISDFKKKGRLLEIGCACGFLLDEARQSGWEASGIEPSRWAAEYARDALGLDVTNGALEDSDIDKGAFDVIVAIDVLEHLSDPKSALKKMRESLKEDGLLYVAIPDISSAASRLFKSRWWGIKRHHLYYFTKETLRLLLEREGFEVVRKAYYLRYFTLGYITTLLDAHNSAFTRTIKHLLQWVSLTDKQVSLNLYDQTAIFSRKKRKLEDIINIEDAGRETIRAMKTTVVLPAYNAAKTLRRTLFDIPEGTADEIILVDDASRDNTVEIARDLELKVFTHDKNSGYGANQKTCYDEALKAGADIVVMLHPDYQYDPALIPELIAPIKKGEADAVFGSRMMKGGALEGGMPKWKHNANILLTALENVVLGTYLTEYHSGFRAYSRRLLETIDFKRNSDGFIFDTEIIVQLLLKGFKIEEIPIKTRYFDEASSIGFMKSCGYGLGIFKTLFKYILHVKRVIHFKQFG